MQSSIICLSYVNATFIHPEYHKGLKWKKKKKDLLKSVRFFSPHI